MKNKSSIRNRFFFHTFVKNTFTYYVHPLEISRPDNKSSVWDSNVEKYPQYPLNTHHGYPHSPLLPENRK